MDTFLERSDFSGKTVIPFATSGGSGIEKAERSLKSHCPQANWKKGKLLNHMDAAAWTKKRAEFGVLKRRGRRTPALSRRSQYPAHPAG